MDSVLSVYLSEFKHSKLVKKRATSEMLTFWPALKIVKPGELLNLNRVNFA